jgi:hypothetical protein
VDKESQKMKYNPEFHGRPNISMLDMSSFIGMLEEVFKEDYADANKIQATSFQM